MNKRIQVLVMIIFISTFLALTLSLIQLFERKPLFSKKKLTNFSSMSLHQKGLAQLTLKGIIQNTSPFDGIYADKVVETIEQIENTDLIVGLIIELDSPGGEVGATKKIYEALKKLKQKKPIVTYINDIAASGGYYIASISDRIIAREFSIIGSIGVISIQPNISKLLNTVGINISIYKSGKYKDSISPFRESTEEEKEMYQEIIDTAYITFINDVAEGRKQSYRIVKEEWADGRIFSGKKSKALQMIDDIGGFLEALNTMKILLKTTEDLPIYKLEDELPYFFKFLKNYLDLRYFMKYKSNIYYLLPDSNIVNILKIVVE